MKKRKIAIVKKSRTKPEIYVRIKTLAFGYTRNTYARASIVKRGDYQFLQWRDNDTVRRLYLGKKRK